MKAYTVNMFGGKSSGTCSECGRTLKNPESIARGIGPICAGGGSSRKARSPRSRNGGGCGRYSDGPGGDDLMVYAVGVLDDERSEEEMKIDQMQRKTVGYTESGNGVCDVEIYEHRNRVVVVITEVPDNRGISVTNSIEKIAENLLQERRLPYNTIWVEHYPHRPPDARYKNDPQFKETFDLVRFKRVKPFGGPVWKRISEEEYLRLIGREEEINGE